MGQNIKDVNGKAYTITSYSEDLSLAGNESGAANIAAVLATLIVDLQAQGIVKGTSSA